ncbi:mechanosensitive ion channel family protein [Clostridium vincentii]|uniref:Putative MscS family protein YkuT n=1 Tax=Clostridium vincentii TaxID=52704 RepID=A0A2T0BBY9_9CLOT|nr:mechanosensitive ion channel family protein [Clostridium vincentii]PRR81404.1 putative MscS family protein YkuT [Clostridium vincentii]
MIENSFLNIIEDGINIGSFTLELDQINTILDNTIVQKVIKIVITLIAILIVIKLGNYIIEKFIQRQIKSNGKFSMNLKKVNTVGAVLRSILKYTTYFIGGSAILSNFFNGLTVGAAGVGGVAILGLGAQSLIKDVINGFFILFEDQYGVGDHVTLGSFGGIVESIGIRSTVIRGFNGDVHVITNGSIVEVTNHSRGNIRFLVDILIPYEEDADKAIKAISKVTEKFKDKNEAVTDPVEILGITSLNQSSVTIRVVGKSMPLTQWSMENKLRKEIKEALEAEGIKAPYPKTEFINNSKGEVL